MPSFARNTATLLDECHTWDKVTVMLESRKRIPIEVRKCSKNQLVESLAGDFPLWRCRSMSIKILESHSMVNLEKHCCLTIFRLVYNAQSFATLLQSIPRPLMYVPKIFPSQVRKTPPYPIFLGFPLEAPSKLSLMKPDPGHSKRRHWWEQNKEITTDQRVENEKSISLRY